MRATLRPAHGFALLELAVAITMAAITLTGMAALSQSLSARGLQALDAQLHDAARRSQAEQLDGCGFGGSCSPPRTGAELQAAAVGCNLRLNSGSTALGSTALGSAALGSAALVVAGCRR